MPRRPTRREFLQSSVLASSALLLPRKAAAFVPPRPRRGRLRVAAIGVANRGRDNLNELAKQEVDIVGLCDVDRRYLDQAHKSFSGAAVFRDYHEMLRKLRELDAVVVSTPDHTHAPATELALRLGYDVYCEKPLTHTVEQARSITELAASRHAVTQMGIQIHAWPNYRRVVELIESGAIGPVHAAHVFCGKTWSGGKLPDGPGEDPPDWLDWDLWLGTAPKRPFHPKIYHPAQWRRWWDFGGGTLGDMGCHYMDLAFWALQLRRPTRVEATAPAKPDPQTTPRDLVVRYDFPARGELPPVEVTWYDTAQRPPMLEGLGLGAWANGVLFLGKKGWVIGDYTKHQIGPREAFADFEPPAPYIPDSVGHYKEWVEACQSRARTSCDFRYSGPLSEAVLLGNVAYRKQAPVTLPPPH